MADLYRKSALEKIASPEQLDKAFTITSPLSWIALIGVSLIVVVTVIWSIWGVIPVTVSANGIVASPQSTNSIYTDQAGTVVAVLVKTGDEVAAGDAVMQVKAIDGTVTTILSDQTGTVSQIVAATGDTVHQSSEIIRVSPRVSSGQVVVCYVPLSDAKKLERGMSAYIYLSSVDSQTYGHMVARIVNIDAYATSNASMSNVLGSDNNLTASFTENGAVAAVACELYPDSTASGYYWSNEKGGEVVVTNGSLASCKIITEEVAPITKLFSKLADLWEH